MTEDLLLGEAFAQLKASDARVRQLGLRKMLWVAAESWNVAAEWAVSPLLFDADVNVRRQAVWLLEAKGSKASLRGLQEVAEHDKDAEVRAYACRAFGKLGGRTPVLIKLASDAHADVAYEALCALSARQIPLSLRAIRKNLLAADDEFRAIGALAVVRSAGMMTSKRVRDLIDMRLVGEDRKAVLCDLAEVAYSYSREEKYLDVMVALGEDREGEVRARAFELVFQVLNRDNWRKIRSFFVRRARWDEWQALRTRARTIVASIENMRRLC